MIPVDLETCADEPIRIPGTIQPHGALLIVDPPGGRVLAASANAPAVLGMAKDVAESGLPPAVLADLATVADEAGASRHQFLSGPGGPLDLIAHRRDDLLLIEAEPAPPDRDPWAAWNLLDTSTLQAQTDADALCRTAAALVRKVSGFDRVMIYRFDDDGHGTVIAESREAEVDSYLGQHFPASDIPAQARALYLENGIRVIPDANYVPVPLVPAEHPDTGAPFDLSFAGLRGISPIHLEYLANMGVRASASISLTHHGRLWGLIACHHHAPKPLSFDRRRVLAHLGQATSLALTPLVDLADSRHQVHQAAIGQTLLARLVEAGDPAAQLFDSSPGPGDLIASGGVCLALDGDLIGQGARPPDPAIRAVLAHAAETLDREGVFTSSALGRELPALAGHEDTAAGVLVARIPAGEGGADALLWFRPEEIQVRDWAGDPSKAAGWDGNGGRLSPRKSFETWQEIRRGRSRAWRTSDHTAARTLALGLAASQARQRHILQQTNAELARLNANLEEFAYAASHDLQAPLRKIEFFADALNRSLGPRLAGDDAELLTRMGQATRRMRQLVEDLLAYSRVVRTGVEGPVDLNPVVGEVLDDLDVLLRDSGSTVVVAPDLPTVMAAPTLMKQVFQNLLTNAIKFARPGTPPRVAVTACAGPHGPRVTVADQGVGIRPDLIPRIFRPFERLGTLKDVEGSGIGLAVVRKAMETMGGQVQAESDGENGTRFHLDFPAPGPPRR